MRAKGGNPVNSQGGFLPAENGESLNVYKKLARSELMSKTGVECKQRGKGITLTAKQNHQ